MPNEHILVIEDDEDIQELIRYNLSRNGFHVSTALTGEDGLKKIRLDLVNCVLIDIVLPGIGGFDVCKAIKKDSKLQNIPMIMISARDEEIDMILGLELGADDYIVKPFSPNVFIARVRSVLRYKAIKKFDTLSKKTLNDMEIHPSRNEIAFRGKRLDLTNMEFQIMHLLASQPGWVFTRNQVYDRIHSNSFSVSDRSVDVIIVGLRKKLGETGCFIETVRGVGYKLTQLDKNNFN